MNYFLKWLSRLLLLSVWIIMLAIIAFSSTESEIAADVLGISMIVFILATLVFLSALLWEAGRL